MPGSIRFRQGMVGTGLEQIEGTNKTEASAGISNPRDRLLNRGIIAATGTYNYLAMLESGKRGNHHPKSSISLPFQGSSDASYTGVMITSRPPLIC